MSSRHLHGGMPSHEGKSRAAGSDVSGNAGQAVILHIPGGAVFNGSSSADEGLFRYLHAIWQARAFITIITAVVASLAIAYALLATPRYRAAVLLAPVEQEEMQGAFLGQLSGLAGLAGINIGQSSGAEALAILGSRKFTREFIEERNLLPILYSEEWDSTKGAWRSDDPQERPDIRDAVRRFQESILELREDKTTGLVTIVIEWKDPTSSAEWANALAKNLNATLRARALAEGGRNIEYLSSRIKNTSNLTLQQAIASLLEREMQKVMMAQGNEEFAYRVLDPANAPKRRSWPMRTLIVLAGAFVGAFISIIFVLIRSEFRSHRRLQSAAGTTTSVSHGSDPTADAADDLR